MGDNDNILIRNKKAFHDYQILESFEAGIELRGTEVKSCRQRNISLADTYVKIQEGEAFLLNAHISPYEHGNRFNHDPRRERRLLLRKREIRKLHQQTREKGCTIVPLRFYLKKGRVKVEVALAKGKTKGDKREDLKRKDDERTMRRAISR